MNDRNLQSPKWRDLDEKMMTRKSRNALHDAIVNIAQGKDELQEGLVDAANTLVEISSVILSVKNHEEDFKRLFWSASVLVIVLWRLHDEHRRGPTSRKIWPPPELARHFDKFVKTVCRIHEFMKRNSETISKRIVSGYFGIRDIGKFKKYQQKLDSVALALENIPNSINIHAILVQAVDTRAQPDDEHSVLSKESTKGNSNSSINRAKKRAVIQAPTAESSRLTKVESSSTLSEESRAGDSDPPVEQDRKKRADIQRSAESSYMRRPKYNTLSKNSTGDDSDSPVKKGKKRADIQEPTTGGSRSRKPKHADLSDNSSEDDSDPPVRYKEVEGVDQTGSKLSRKSKGKNRATEDEPSEERSAQYRPVPKKIPTRSTETELTPQRELKGGPSTRKVVWIESDDEAPRSEDKGKGIKFKKPQLEDVEEGIAQQSPRKAASRTNAVVQSKAGERQGQRHEVKPRITDNVPVEEPVLGKTIRKKKQRSPTAPVPISHPSISDFSFQNQGSGEMSNLNLGNIRNTRNRWESDEESNPNVFVPRVQRSQTDQYPISSISDFNFINQGTGTMNNENVANIQYSTIQNVGNDYSVNVY